MSNIVDQAVERCGNNYRSGYNCAESVFLAFQELVLPHVQRDIVRGLTGFGEGIGQSGCICGALTASLLVLNLITGRTSNSEGRPTKSYELASKLVNNFEDSFGSTCCRALSPTPFESKERLRNCLRITKQTGQLLMEYLLSENLINADELVAPQTVDK